MARVRIGRVCTLVVGLLVWGAAARNVTAQEVAVALPPPGSDTSEARALLPSEPALAPQPIPEGGAAHTGFKTLFKDTGGDFKHMVTDLAPMMWMGLGGAGAWIVHPLDDNVNRHFISAASDSFWSFGKVLGLGYVQIGGAVATWGVGRAIDKHGRAAHIGLDLLRAQIVTQSLTYGLKYTVRRDRPDLSDGYSFPSGHASTTFASASVLEAHFGWKFGVPGYALATYVAASRLHENRHWLSDVVFGGALGMAAGRSVTRHGRNQFALVPLAVPDGMGIALTRITNN